MSIRFTEREESALLQEKIEFYSMNGHNLPFHNIEQKIDRDIYK